MIYEQRAQVAEQAPGGRRREANLERIVEAAARLVEEDGLEGLSMARLAEAADYTAGALYRYVESKDALLALLVQRILGDIRASMLAAVAELAAGAGPLEQVTAMVRGYRGIVTREPQRYGVLAVALATPRILVAAPGAAAAATAAVVATLGPLADALTAAVAAGELEDGDAVERTLAVFALLHGLAQLPKLAHHAPGAFDVERLVRGGVRGLLIGWGAAPRTVDAALEGVGMGASAVAVGRRGEGAAVVASRGGGALVVARRGGGAAVVTSRRDGAAVVASRRDGAGAVTSRGEGAGVVASRGRAKARAVAGSGAATKAAGRRGAS